MDSALQLQRPGGLVHELALRHRPFTQWGVFYLVLTFASLAAGILDERLINGVSVWNKPFKFNLSIAVYFLTLAWFAPLMGAGYFRTRPGRVLTAVPLLCALLEIVYILFQASLAEPSHFNTSTRFNAMAYSAMGFGAVMMVAASLWMGVVILWRGRGRMEPYVLAVGLGLILTFALGGGFGGYLGSQSGHWVGAAETDANGTALFKWARDGGDLRVAHFFGMHAMQVLPVAGWLAARKLSRKNALLAVGGMALVYSAFSLQTFLQAVAGRPFL